MPTWLIVVLCILAVIALVAILVAALFAAFVVELFTGLARIDHCRPPKKSWWKF